MAEKKSGPVKPPTLDMQARRTSPRTPSKAAETPKSEADESGVKPETASETPGTSAEKDTSQASKTASHPPRQNPSNEANSWIVPAAMGAGGGALIGVLVVLGLAAGGVLGGLMPGADDDDLSTRITMAEEQVSESLVGFNAINQRLTALQDQVDALGTGDSAELEALIDRQDQLAESLASLEQAPQAAFDPAPLETRLDNLATRLDAIGSGASGDEAAQLAAELTAIRSQISEMTARSAEIEQAMAELQSHVDEAQTSSQANAAALTEIRDQVAAIEAEPALPPADTRLLRLPFALSGLETALDNGRPFAAELEDIVELAPGLTPSEELTTRAARGLPAPARITVAFSRAVPAIMAARPADPDAGWDDALWARIKSMLAIRPADPAEGDAVESLLAGVEQQLQNRNFTAAAASLAQLPPEMQEAAGPVADDIALMGEAQTMLTEARALALEDNAAPAETPSEPVGEAVE